MLELLEPLEQQRGIGTLKIEARHLHFILVIDVTIGDGARRRLRPHQVIDTVHVLQVHGDAFESVSDLARHWTAVQPADLLKIRELRDLHAVQPHFPTQAPGPQRRRFPVVLHEADVVEQRVHTQAAQGIQIHLLDVGGRRFQHHLVLIIMLQAVRVVPVTAIRWAARGLYVGRAPWLRADGAQKGGRVKRAGAHLHVIGLLDHAAALRPEALQMEDKFLKGHGRAVISASKYTVRREMGRSLSSDPGQTIPAA